MTGEMILFAVLATVCWVLVFVDARNGREASAARSPSGSGRRRAS
jgi:hypothetical protein